MVLCHDAPASDLLKSYCWSDPSPRTGPCDSGDGTACSFSYTWGELLLCRQSQRAQQSLRVLHVFTLTFWCWARSRELPAKLMGAHAHSPPTPTHPTMCTLNVLIMS